MVAVEVRPLGNRIFVVSRLRLLIVGFLCAAFFAYSAYVYTVGTRLTQPVAYTDAVRDGQGLFQKHNCIACHQFYGLGGYMGPDLTNVISSPGKGPLYARALMTAGTARMPNFHLSAAELDALIAFLEYADASGKYPAEAYEIRWYGTLEHAR
jgi:nitric oxide reductase subunit C